MKILLYNWTDFDGGAGGGVSVYLRSLIPELVKREGVEVFFLSSGQHYGLIDRRPRIEETQNLFAESGVRSFRIVNSPVKAPGHDAFYAIDTWRSNDVLFKLVRDFIRQNGPFDAFHLHSLEGMSGNVLAMTQAIPDTQVFYTLHNFMPYCPQIEMQYAGMTQCRNFLDGTKCVGCLGGHKRAMEGIIARQRLSSSLERRGLAGHQIGNFLFGFAQGMHRAGVALRYLFLDIRDGLQNRFRGWGLRRTEPIQHPRLDRSLIMPAPVGDALDWMDGQAEGYRRWRRENATLLNKSVARVFAVSELVKDEVRDIGESVENIDVIPLGVDFSSSRAEMLEAFDAKPQRDLITISYIGYNNTSKGVPFLLNAFETMDNPFLKEHVRLLMICRMDAAGRRQMLRMKNLFRDFQVIDGYDRLQLPTIAHTVDLNIVPSICRETFNLVTAEMMAFGTPSLLSSNVGAKQFIRNQKDFVFDVGSSQDFAAKLLPLVKSTEKRRAFFVDGLLELPTIEEHADRIMSAYETRRHSKGKKKFKELSADEGSDLLKSGRGKLRMKRKLYG